MNVIIKKSFSLNLRILRAFCLYPPDNPTLSYKVTSYIMFLLFTILLPFLVLLHLILEEDTDKMQKNLNFVYLAQVMGFAPKLLLFVTRSNEIKRCINYFEAPCFVVYRDDQKKITDDVIGVCRRNDLVFFVALIAGSNCWIIRPLLLKDCMFPVYIWLPFNAIAEPIYYFVFVFIAIGIYYPTFSAMVDPLLGGLAYQAAGQLKILKTNLQHISEYAQDEFWKEDGNIKSEKITTKFEFIYWKIKQCIEHHEAILDFVKEYEKCFSLSLFSQLATSVLVICFLCQRVGTIKEFNFNATTYIIFISIILGQIYFYCYYGTIISEESDSLTTAIYMCNWYQYDVKSKKALIMLMERSQRPLVVTAGKVVYVSLQTFATILRRSYSLIAVLKNF